MCQAAMTKVTKPRLDLDQETTTSKGRGPFAIVRRHFPLVNYANGAVLPRVRKGCFSQVIRSTFCFCPV